MTKYVWKHLPNAIYLDTNALRSAGPRLEAPWISELLSITANYGISLCISGLVLTEWCEHIMEVLKNNHDKLRASIDLLGHFCDTADINPDDVNLPEKTQLIESVSQKLERAGFQVVSNWNGPLSQLLAEALEKRPPFEQGGKGLCDAVILESYVKHAKGPLGGTRVLVVSNDRAVQRSEDRFKREGITVDFIGTSDVAEKLKSLLSNENNAYIEEKRSRLKENILAHQSAILDFVKSTPLRITNWMLNGPFVKEEDRVHGTIESILSVRPARISDVLGGAPVYGEEVPPDRYPVLIFVELEIDILVRQYDFGLLIQPMAIVQPNMIDKDSPVTLEKGTDYQLQEVRRTITRSATVFATIDAVKEKQDVVEGFRIEKVI
ncbi:MAG: PIN domain-containing protein [Planctomycetota bacterium]